MPAKRYLTAKEAAEQLNISMATLYAYVSRGLIRSEETVDDSRQRRYLVEDVQKLRDRKTNRRDPAKTAQSALDWGVPVLESALTRITDTHLYYRGQDACELAQTRTFEEVAALLWTDSTDKRADLFNPPSTFDLLTISTRSAMAAMTIALALAAERDPGAYPLTASRVAQTGARIIDLLTSVLSKNTTPGSHSAAALADSWHTDYVRLIDAALILCADHELNASSFVARIVASTDSTPYAVVIGGLATLGGFKHGGLTRRVSAFMKEIEHSTDIPAAVQDRLQRGDPIPGFGHRLYPEGDPRAALLLNLIAQTAVDQPYRDMTNMLIEAVYNTIGEHPTIDFALVILERVLNLPPDSALNLFALGRTAGWIGHAIEQYASDHLIRPRARYTGKLPMG